MTNLSHAQVLGMTEDVGQACVTETKALEDNGTDREIVVRRLNGLRDEVIALNAEQEELKRQLKAKTALYRLALKRLYAYGSGLLDTLIAAVSKDSPSAKNLRMLRSRIRRPREAPATETTQ